jgi:hypothetical protein
VHAQYNNAGGIVYAAGFENYLFTVGTGTQFGGAFSLTAAKELFAPGDYSGQAWCFQIEPSGIEFDYIAQGELWYTSDGGGAWYQFFGPTGATGPAGACGYQGACGVAVVLPEHQERVEHAASEVLRVLRDLVVGRAG